MNYVYTFTNFPVKNKELVFAANAAATRVYEKLTSAGVYGPCIDEYYRKRFYENDLNNLVVKLKMCTYHVIGAISRNQKPLSKMSLIDHGGGLGLISLLAKEMGVGRVIYNDIDAKFAEAAQGIARTARSEPDQYIVGDINKLVETLGDDVIDSLVSYDVLEHIYNLDEFFFTLCNAPCCPRVLFMSSGANMFRLSYLRRVIPIQHGRELLNCCKRITIIRNCAPELTEEKLVLLSRKTRLLVRNEIENVTKLFIENKKKVELPHKTGANAYDPFGSNTVDPETGWWAEHLFNPFYLARQLRKHGFTSKILPGFHGGKKKFILNPFIRIAGAVLALPISPFYTLSATRYGSYNKPETLVR